MRRWYAAAAQQWANCCRLFSLRMTLTGASRETTWRRFSYGCGGLELLVLQVVSRYYLSRNFRILGETRSKWYGSVRWGAQRCLGHVDGVIHVPTCVGIRDHGASPGSCTRRYEVRSVRQSGRSAREAHHRSGAPGRDSVPVRQVSASWRAALPVIPPYGFLRQEAAGSLALFRPVFRPVRALEATTPLGRGSTAPRRTASALPGGPGEKPVPASYGARPRGTSVRRVAPCHGPTRRSFRRGSRAPTQASKSGVG